MMAVVSDTLSAIVSRKEGVRSAAALYVGLFADRPQQPPARYGLAGVDRVDLGRGERRVTTRATVDGADVLALALADHRMSSQHARISRVGDSWVLEDLGSKNGTWIASRRTQRHILRDGDAIVVGHTVLVFRANGGELDDTEGLPHAPLGWATLSPTLAERFADLEAAATTLVPIEVTGETGTGKELVARGVHERSRRSGRFVAVNCGAIPANLIEAELFGHRKGAFTGAGEERLGLIRSADGGTLFLDEIAELPPAAQASLLRVLQEREVVPIGSDRPVRVDLRVVSATHRSLDRDVESGRFRADLRARLLGFAIELPPLRDRREDLGHVIAALLERLSPGREVAFTIDAATALYDHSWPLNIRELERSLAGALAVARGRIEPAHLPQAVREPTSTPPGSNVEQIAVEELSDDDRRLRDELAAAIARHGGNLAAVARELGKDRTQIRRWMKRFGLARGEELA
jgi:sigma-54 dependent transcriptional regulator, acetoin dehydrogenase operon transcriptional activator AcoR